MIIGFIDNTLWWTVGNQEFRKVMLLWIAGMVLFGLGALMVILAEYLDSIDSRLRLLNDMLQKPPPAVS